MVTVKAQNTTLVEGRLKDLEAGAKLYTKWIILYSMSIILSNCVVSNFTDISPAIFRFGLAGLLYLRYLKILFSVPFIVASDSSCSQGQGLFIVFQT